MNIVPPLNKNFTIAVIFIVSLSLTLMIIGKNASLHYSVMDLGLATHTFFGINDLEEYSRVLFGHIQPYLLLYAIIWGLFKSTYLIVLLQLFFLLLPIYYIFKKYNNISALAYLLYFPLWFNALFDFHIDHLSIPILFGFFLAVENKKYLWAAVFSIALGFVKEIFILQTIMCGLYIIVHGYKSFNSNRKIIYIGLLTIVIGVYYFIVTFNYISFDQTEYKNFGLSSEAFSWLGNSISEVLWYLINNVVEIIIDILNTPRKVIYLIALFGALGFVPLLSPGPLIVALPILAVSLLSSYQGYYGLGHHYTAGLIAPMIIAFAGGLPRAITIWKRAGFSAKWFTPILMIGLLFAHIALSPSPISRLFWSDKVWSYNYRAYIPTERDRIIKKAISDYIPAGSDIVVSIQNTLNLDSLMKRRQILLFPDGVSNEKLSPFFSKGFQSVDIEWRRVKADYVILDIKRPWFINDQGCKWLYSECTDKKMAAEYLEWISKSRKLMNVIFEKDGFLILSRDRDKTS
jgi:uncharacterized membrane protein